MKIALKLLGLLLVLTTTVFSLHAQAPDQVQDPGQIMLDPMMEDPNMAPEADPDRPLDGVVEKEMIATKRVLPYDHIREADILWQQRVWRVVDVREKMNLPFAYPPRPFFTILQEAAESGEIRAFSTEDDQFSHKLAPEEIGNMGASIDTVVTFDPVTYEEKIQVVRNELNPEDIKRFRIKEDWFFDEETSTLQVRVLGIAPLKEEYDENGNFKYELPMFWIYYPEAREVLAREKVYTMGNDAAPLTWEDLMEMRFFSSYIYKASNVYDRRIEDYAQGIDILLESDKIRQEIFNFEHDLWEY